MSDVAKWELCGPVRTVRVHTAEWDSATQDWKTTGHSRLAMFHPNGTFAETRHNNPDGSVASNAFLYDEGGRLTEMRFHMNDALTGRVFYEHDDAGRHLRTIFVNIDGTRAESEVSSYDAGGRRTMLRFLAPEKPNTFHAYGLDGVAGRAYGAPGATTMTVVYDERALPAEILFHDTQHRLLRHIVVSRDDAGRELAEEVRVSGLFPFPEMAEGLKTASEEERAHVEAMFVTLLGPSGALAKTTFLYDAKGRVAETIVRLAGLSEQRTTFCYDEHDNVVEQSMVETDRDVGRGEQGSPQKISERSSTQHTRFEYQYDTEGNWTERVVWSRLEPDADFERSNVERRDITYYM